MNTGTGYKLFESKNGRLYPLFIDKKTEVPVGKWIPAENHPTKNFAPRPGWHVGEIPDAPWLKSANGTYKSRFARGKRVWAEVEYNCTVNYDSEVSLLPRKSFTDRVPANGSYIFREAGKGNWVITSDLRVTRILEESERQEILLSLGYDEEEAFKPYKEIFRKKGLA